MKQINITRSNGTVTFEEVSIDATENVFFTNLDPLQAHWPYVDATKFPDFCNSPVGPPPSSSSNSSQCPVPAPSGNPKPPYTVTYKCKNHSNESGKINVFAQLAAANKTLPPVKVNQSLPPSGVQVVTGGKSPYTITGQMFQITGSNPVSGSNSIGPGLKLNASTNNQGISVTGTPTVVGTYNFTFTVDDGMGRNLQQVQYSMVVS